LRWQGQTSQFAASDRPGDLEFKIGAKQGSNGSASASSGGVRKGKLHGLFWDVTAGVHKGAIAFPRVHLGNVSKRVAVRNSPQ